MKKSNLGCAPLLLLLVTGRDSILVMLTSYFQLCNDVCNEEEAGMRVSFSALFLIYDHNNFTY